MRGSRWCCSYEIANSISTVSREKVQESEDFSRVCVLIVDARLMVTPDTVPVLIPINLFVKIYPSIWNSWTQADSSYQCDEDAKGKRRREEEKRGKERDEDNRIEERRRASESFWGITVTTRRSPGSDLSSDLTRSGTVRTVREERWYPGEKKKGVEEDPVEGERRKERDRLRTESRVETRRWETETNASVVGFTQRSVLFDANVESSPGIVHRQEQKGGRIWPVIGDRIKPPSRLATR